MRILSSKVSQVLVFTLFLLSHQLSLAGQRIEVHVSLSDAEKKSTLQNLNGALPSYLKARHELLQKTQADQIPVVEIWDSSTERFIGSLQDSQVLGLIWVGEARPVYDSKRAEDDPKDFLSAVYNTHLEDSDRLNIPKSILTAAHKNLGFVGWNTCFWSLIRKFYDFSVRPDLLIHPFRLSDEELSRQHPLQENVVPAVGLRNIYQKISQNWATLRSQIRKEVQPVLPKLTLSIEYDDLLSQSFAYTVSVKNPRGETRLLGVLTKQSQKVEWMIPKEFFEAGSALVIQPDDPKRVSLKVKNPIDNVLIRSVILNSRPLLSGTVHLGDLDLTDDEIQLSLPQNRGDLRKLPVQESLELPLGLAP